MILLVRRLDDHNFVTAIFIIFSH